MHEHHRQVEFPLKRTNVGQQPGHFAGVVLVDAVQPHQGVQQQQPRAEPLGRFLELPAVCIVVEPQRGGGDHMDLHLLQSQTAMPCHSFHALPHDRQRVLGQVDQDRPRSRDGVPAQASRAGSHAQGKVQPQPSLRALGSAADHAHRQSAPQLFHQPAWGAVFLRDLSDPHHRKRPLTAVPACRVPACGWLVPRCLVQVSRHRQALAFFFAAGRGRAA